MRSLAKLVLGAAWLIGCPQLQAQQLGLEYNTELQTDFRGKYNWANLLRLSGALSLSQSVSIEASAISVARTSQEPIIDDLQGFSNIDECGLPLGIAVLGVEWQAGRSTCFIGIRNVNEDYFATPLTSLFVNSSCGIFPTISGNYDIANYPLSSWCVHYKAQWERVALQTSLYAGLARSRIAGHGNIFRLSPRRDGIFSITSAEYDNNGSNYSVGCAVHYGVRNSDEACIEAEAQAASGQAQAVAPKSLSAAPWVNIEQRLSDALSAMLQASYSISGDDCRCYFGAGGSCQIGKATLGLFADYAKYEACAEVAAELTCRIPLTPQIALQPAIEVIRTGSRTSAVGISRLIITI